MAHVTSLAQHILSLEPDKDAARLCLYHYLKNLCEATEPVNSELLNRFYFRALTFEHWQKNKTHLFHEVTSILQHFQDTSRELLPLDGTLTLEDLQVVPLENVRTLELIVDKYLRSTSAPFDQFRTIREGTDGDSYRVIAITLQGDRTLKVTAFPNVAMIRNGELVPLCQDFNVAYGADLTLLPAAAQSIEIGPHTAARFSATHEGIFGTIVRGYTFQRFSTLDGGGLHKYPMLFYPLKRLEQFFVDRKSDPMYIELTNLLEKALELMNSRHPEAMKFAKAALERGQLALEHIFPDDRLVRLLINNLEKTVALEVTSHSLQASYAASYDASFDTSGAALDSRVRRMSEDAPEGTFPISVDLPIDRQL